MRTRYGPTVALEEALASVELLLLRDPASIEGRYVRACFLREVGRWDEAIHAYRALRDDVPAHAGALNNLAVLLHRCNARSEARQLFEQAVERFPESAVAHVNLANVVVVDDPERARGEYERALVLDPGCAQAHQGLCGLYAQEGDRARAAHHRKRGYCGHALSLQPYYGDREPIGAVALLSTDGGNLATETVLDNRVFAVTKVFVEAWSGEALPPHALVLNAIADPDRASDAALERAVAIVATSGRPVINAPEVIRGSGRLDVAQRLRRVAGVRLARMDAFTRAQLYATDATRLLRSRGFVYPMLLRSPGHHMGRHFLRVDDAAHLRAAAEALPGDMLLAIEYLDTAAGDGTFRKYRVMLVNGQAYPLHLAISRDWKVHYFSAEMEHSIAYQAEEARFLRAMPMVLGATATAALAAIAAELRLDYAGVDCTLGADGSLIVFEATAAMAIAPAPQDSTSADRAAAVHAIQAALRAMCRSRAGVYGHR
jgi:tetratricopeptide (TPR) repeat protein